MLVRDLQQVVSIEAREQFLEMTGKLQNIVAACVGGGSNAMGIFAGFIDDPINLGGRGDKDMDYMIEHHGTAGEFAI